MLKMAGQDNYYVEMNKVIQQVTSFILPVTVLIIVPLCIERDISVKHTSTLVTGLFIMILGLALMTVTIMSFIKTGRGTLAPWSPTKKLITTGLYGYVRNPMILGVFTVLIGESVAILSHRIFIWALIFFLVNNVWFLIYEEPGLGRKFGDEYKEYKKNVPRWIPRLTPYKGR
jgi:protein-S-isoprenylcysteine O-methyltransferase Ste14